MYKYKKTDYTDCCINTSGKSFYVHKNYISETSQTIASYLKEKDDIDFKDEIDECNFMYILDYIYGKDKKIPSENILEILLFSHKYNINVVKDYCINYVKNYPKNITIEYLDNMWDIFKNYNIKKIIEYIINNNIIKDLLLKIEKLKNKELKNEFLMMLEEYKENIVCYDWLNIIYN